jgi:hypothetical protein
MWTKTPNRLFALALLPVVACLPVWAQNNGNAAPARLPDFDNVQSQRLNRQPYTRPQPGTSGIPPLAPTEQPAPPPVQAPTETASTQQATYSQPQSPAQRAAISFNAGKLSVVATNSSLNQILRDISRLAGITITGGVSEERVFGSYGPGAPSAVLDELLDGTGTNMLYIQGSGDRKAELVLTSRTGGPTPPNPNAARFDTDDQEQTPPPPPAAATQTPPDQPSAPPPPGTSTAVTGDNTTPAPPAASGASSSSTGSNGEQSNGVKTPQQIFDELMKLRQQNQQQPQ